MLTDDTETKQIAIRLPVPILARLEGHAQRLKERNPGVKVTRADAIRALLLNGLQQAEGDEPHSRPKKAKK